MLDQSTDCDFFSHLTITLHLDYISVHACVCVYKKSVNTLWNCETVDRFIR